MANQKEWEKIKKQEEKEKEDLWAEYLKRLSEENEKEM